MKSIRVLCLILALMLTVVGCERKLTKSLHEVAVGGELEQEKDSPPQPQSTKRVEKYVYKQTPQGELAIHVHFPPDWSANDKRPAIVFFFGGSWKVGTVRQFVPQAEYLAGRGMVTARADYRVRSRHGTAPDKCVEDGKSAVRWLRANASKLGIDPDRIAASGSSAGGHIAACTYTTKGLEGEGEDLSVSSKPNLLVLFNAALDYTPRAERIGSKVKISPNHNLTKDVPPTILFYGTEDRRVLDGLDFIKNSKKLGTIAELYMAEGQAHGFSKRSPWLERTIYLMDKFLARYGYARGEPTIKLPEGKVEMEKISPISLNAKWGYTPLHCAARYGDKELAELLIANGDDVNSKDSWGCTPLLSAAREGQKELVELLIAKGAGMNVNDKWSYTPLVHAARYGDKELVELLIANGANVNFTPNDRYSTILYAVWNGDKDMVRLLVTKGTDVNFTPKNDFPPLHYAVWWEDMELAKLYVNYGARFDMKDQDSWTAFRYAAWEGNRELVEFFVAKGADVSSFHMAACVGDLTRMRRFVDEGADVNTKDDELKWTPLHWAAFTGPQDVVEFLLAKGASVNVKDEFNSTPLHHAAVAGQKKLVELLLAKGANVNAKGSNNRTPLHSAARAGHRDVVEILVVNGADVNVNDDRGRTPLWWANRRAYDEIVELLRKHGAEE